MRVVVAWLVAGSVILLQTTNAPGELPPLIPRDVLFGNPDKLSPKISPDGERLAFLAPDEGVMNVWVRSIGDHDDRPVTKDRHRGVREYFWAENNEHILYVQDEDGDENWHVYAVNLKTNEVRDLTPFDGVHASVIATEARFPNEILVVINNRNPQLHDVYRANLITGKLTLEAKNKKNFAGWLSDRDFRVRAGMTVTSDGGTALLVRDTTKSRWRKLATWDAENSLGSGPIGFTPDGKGLYLISSTGANTSQLRRIDFKTGKETTLAYDEDADLYGVVVHPSTYAIQAVSYLKERLHWQVLDPSIEDDFAAIKRIRRGDFGLINRDHDGETWLVYFMTDDGPTYYYVYDRKTKTAKFLFTHRKAAEGLRLAQMEPIEFQARDGLTLHGYLSTPPGLERRNLPMVLKVHGGPWYRDKWGCSAEVQWLTNRGYAVLQVNFRGSKGYGKDFLNAGDREWAGKMQDDLIDGVNWAVNKGIADPNRVAIYGGSYGGYAALVGLTFTPEVFRCGVSIVGPSNLVTWMKTVPPYWKPIEPILFERVGHPVKDAKFLKSRSPLYKVDCICRPLLIAQGANDPRVKKSESQQIVKALKEAGKIVEYIEYPDEGHGFARPENRLDFYAKAEKFLATHLGGRYEPLVSTAPGEKAPNRVD